MSVSLSKDDWEELFPERTFTLGKTTLKIQALGLKELTHVITNVMTLFEALKSRGITLENWRSPETIQALSSLLVEELPDLLSRASGLAVEDIPKLPLSIALSLAALCVDVNIDSAEGLVKNFKALGDKLQILGKAVPMIMAVDKD